MKRKFKVELSLSFDKYHKLQKLLTQFGVTEKQLIEQLLIIYLESNEVEAAEPKPHFTQ